jgi:hypothetical protein
MLREDVASAKRANSEGDVKPSGSASNFMVVSTIRGAGDEVAAGAEELEKPRVGLGVPKGPSMAYPTGLETAVYGRLGALQGS